jgi:ADP-ribose pyrophosphatase YjhB (NUDIX family)
MMKYCSQCGGKTKLEIPQDDDRPRFICSQCGFVHYQNPKLVVGSIPVYKDQVLLCLRAIEPRKNYWTLPAGFLENGESIADGAIREAEEEALIKPNLGEIIAIVDVVYAEQVHVFFRARLDNLDFGPGRESLDVKLFKLTEIPWEEIAFKTVKIALKAQISKASDDHIPVYETIT